MSSKASKKNVAQTGIGTSPSDPLKELETRYTKACAVYGNLEMKREAIVAQMMNVKKEMLRLQEEAAALSRKD